jgi:hypothetical protein
MLCVRRSLEKLVSWDFDKLIIAHGVGIKRNAKSFVESTFQMADVSRSKGGCATRASKVFGHFICDGGYFRGRTPASRLLSPSVSVSLTYGRDAP